VALIGFGFQQRRIPIAIAEGGYYGFSDGV
jgi:hypothetical protein